GQRPRPPPDERTNRVTELRAGLYRLRAIATSEMAVPGAWMVMAWLLPVVLTFTDASNAGLFADARMLPGVTLPVTSPCNWCCASDHVPESCPPDEVISVVSSTL